MLSPRLTNCPECANIPSLLRKIDCKLAELGNNLYNNISYMLNKPIPSADIIQLIGYRRILQYKYINPNYAHRYTINMIASRVIRLTVGCVSRCNEPLPCIEIPCNITVIPNPSTTTSTSSSSTSTTTSTTTIPPSTSTTTSSSSTSTTSTSSSTSTTTSSTSSTSSTTTSSTTSPPFVNYQFNDYIRVVEVSSNDHPYVGGNFTMYGATPASRIIKLNTNGTPDTSFVYGSGFNNVVWDILEQPDGKIVVVGQFTSYNGTPAAGIIRLNPNGTPDSSFIYGTGLTGVAGLGIRLAIQSDGKLIVGVQASQYNGTPVSTIMRLNPNGTFDNTFNLTVVQVTANFFFPDRIIVDTNDKFFVSWNNSPGDLSINGNTSGLSMYKFNADGTTDTSFNVISTSIVYRVLDIILRPGAQILTGGQRGVRLYNSDGTLDSGFNIPTVGPSGTSSIQSLGVDLNGNILAGGFFNSVNSITSLYNNIVRFQPDGTIDNTFIQGTGFDLTVLDIAETSDHKFYLGGSFIDYNNIAYYYLVRFNNNGTLDM